MHLPQAIRSLAHERRQRVNRAVHTRVVHRDHRVGQLRTRAHEHLLVEGIAVQVRTCGRGQRRHPNRGNPRDRRGAVHPVGHRDTDGDHTERQGGGDPGRQRMGGLFMRSDNWLQPMPQRATHREQATGEHRADGEQDHRPGHHGRCLVRMGAWRPTLFAEEGHQHHSRHVERGDARTQQRGTAQQRAPDAAGAQCGLDDRILGEEARERRYPDNRQIRQAEGCERDRQGGAQTTVTAHVLLFVHRVNHRAGPKE